MAEIILISQGRRSRLEERFPVNSPGGRVHWAVWKRRKHKFVSRTRHGLNQAPQITFAISDESLNSLAAPFATKLILITGGNESTKQAQTPSITVHKA
jgi:hypothetical protein